MAQKWGEFSKFLNVIRSIKMDVDQSLLALNTVLHTPASLPNDRALSNKKAFVPWQRISPLVSKVTGRNLVPTLTPSSTPSPTLRRVPPDSPYFQKDRDTVEKRSGRWLKDLARKSQVARFDLDRWIPAWKRVSPVGSFRGGISA